MSEPNEIRGTLLKISAGGFYPLIFMQSANNIPRGDAIHQAKTEMFSPCWSGPRQILFLHESGELELWTPKDLGL